MNNVVISGNTTRDPELRATASGTQVLSFSVAVNEYRKTRTGEYESVPNYFDCTMFGNRAEKLAAFLRKGTKVVVTGRLHYSAWEKDGQKRSKVDITVDDIEFMTRRDSTDGR